MGRHRRGDAVRSRRIDFYALRFLLGLAEAGFFPGIIFYLTCWFPQRERAHAIALFMTATSVAGVIAGPLSGVLLTLHGRGGLSGWQWLFLLEGIPAIAMGVAVWRYLPDGPGDAGWLTPPEREALRATLEEDSGSRKLASRDLISAMLSGHVWRLTFFYFLFAFGLYGISFWLPQILKGFGTISVLAVGFASAIPFAAGGVAMVLVGRSSDRKNERRIHLALCALTGAAAIFAAAYSHSPIVELAWITLAAAGTSGCVGPFWAIPAGIWSEAAAAGGIALINSVGNLGGFAGPYLAGFVVQRTNNFAAALLTMGAALALAAIVAIALDRQPT